MSLDGFDGHVEELEFSLGHVTGVRGFKQDRLGRLTGVTRTRVFRPGINVAECTKCETKDLATDACGKCGYYAYFEQDNPEDNNFFGGEVGAVVRGFGRTVVGTKGFRAEKADLVAFFPIDTVQKSPKLKVPSRYDVRSPSRFLYPSIKTYKRWSGTPLAATVILGGLVVMLGLLSLAVGLFVTRNWDLILWIGPAIPVLLFWMSGGISRTIDADLLNTWDTSDKLYRDLIARVRGDMAHPSDSGVAPDFEHLKSLYPGVPVYDTFREAVTEHPLTPADEHQLPEPTPENDPDFWTREVPSSGSGAGMWGGAIRAAGGYVKPGNLSLSINTTSSKFLRPGSHPPPYLRGTAGQTCVCVSCRGM